MKIAIDARMVLDRPTGIGRYITNLIAHLTRIDTENRYVVLVNDRSIIAAVVADKKNVVIREMDAAAMSVKEQIILPWILYREQVDLFHAPSFIIPKYPVCKSVLTLHDLTHLLFPGEFSRLAQIYYRLIVKPAAKRAKRIITDSVSSKNDIDEWLHTSTEKVRVIQLAVESNYKYYNDADACVRIMEKYGIRKKFIMYNGNKKKHKNVEALFKAYFMMRQKMKMDYSLVIVGKRDDGHKETDCSGLEGLANEYEAKDDIIYSGYVNDIDLALLYNAADLFVFPSLYEGFGLPVLEAMSCGCPVVVSNRASLPEVCGDAARYVDPLSVDSICEGMHAVLANTDLKRRMREKGLKRAESFSWEMCAKQTLDVYNEAFNEISNCP